MGKWVTQQRKNKELLPASKKNRLNQLGFIWDVYAAQWKESYGLLMKFKEQEGHCRVPASCVIDGFRLGRWVSRQRSIKNTLTNEYVKLLDILGFIWKI